MSDDIELVIRDLLAGIVGLDRAAVAAMPQRTPLLAAPLSLGSLEGARLLVAIRDRFGVDVAAEDLALDSLESIATLAAFVRARAARPAPPASG